MDLNSILKQAFEHKASDVHFKVNHVPVIRLANGTLYMPEGVQVVMESEIDLLIKEICDEGKLKEFESREEVDIAYELAGLCRFRVNIFKEIEGPSMAFRIIPKEIPEFDALGLPKSVKDFCNLQKGLVLITGQTGSGKSTTLAAILNEINVNRACHIVTIEDPIEFVHQSKKSLVTQREIGSHSMSFVNAIRASLRQDPDVIMIGEMRDYETIATALTLAETGHLVFSTLHTMDAVQSINRIIDVFPSHQQAQIKSQLASTLQGVLSQTLVNSDNNDIRVLVSEVMLINSGIKNCIQEGNISQIYSMMQIGKKSGMQTFSDALQVLKDIGKIGKS